MKVKSFFIALVVALSLALVAPAGATNYYVDGTYTIAGTVPSGLTPGETIIQDNKFSAVYKADTTGGIIVGTYASAYYTAISATPSSTHAWVGRTSAASFTPSAVPVANGNDTTGDGSIGNPWATPGKATTTITGSHPGDSLLIKGNSGFTGVVLALQMYGTGTATPFTIDQYDTGAKPAFYGSVNIPSGPLWVNSATRSDSYTNTYSTTIPSAVYAMASIWESTSGCGTFLYNTSTGEYGGTCVNGWYFQATVGAKRPVSTATLVAGGSGYLGGGSGTVLLQINQSSTPANNQTCVVSCTVASGVVTAVTSAPVCPGISYTAGSAQPTIVKPGQASSAGSGCTITIAIASTQTLSDYLKLVDYWPGTCWRDTASGVLYVHPMYGYVWPNDPGGVDMTVTSPGNDYWVVVGGYSMIGPGAAGVQYVNANNLESYYFHGPTIDSSSINGNVLNYCNFDGFGAVCPRADIYDLNGINNVVKNSTITRLAEMGFYLCRYQMSVIPSVTTYGCYFKDCTVLSTLDPYIDGKYNPLWKDVGYYTCYVDHTESSASQGPYNSGFENITINGNVYGACYVNNSAASNQTYGISFKNIRVKGYTRYCLFRGTNDLTTTVDRLDNTGFPFNTGLGNPFNITNSDGLTITRCKVAATVVGTAMVNTGGSKNAMNITNNIFAGSAVNNYGINIASVGSGATFNIHNNSINGFWRAFSEAGDYTVSWKNNIITNMSGYALYLPAGFNIANNNLSSDYNCGYSFGSKWAFIVSGANYTLISDWYTATNGAGKAQDGHSIAAAALPFVSTSNFHLTTKSPAIGSGTGPLTGVTYDYYWNKIPNGGGKYDIGALQLDRGGF